MAASNATPQGSPADLLLQWVGRVIRRDLMITTGVTLAVVGGLTMRAYWYGWLVLAAGLGVTAWGIRRRWRAHVARRRLHGADYPLVRRLRRGLPELLVDRGLTRRDRRGRTVLPVSVFGQAGRGPTLTLRPLLGTTGGYEVLAGELHNLAGVPCTGTKQRVGSWLFAFETRDTMANSVHPEIDFNIPENYPLPPTDFDDAS